ncbi:MAG: prefoldin subunit alpha [Methanobacteriota archaeon]|nr:MAG: prefoldin subunit alpha [Euryarchaeota archaeon]HIN04232.1 prefoldin subunit alpha [Candidatus Poseidoniales archaeon]
MGTSERRAGGAPKSTSDRAELQRLAQLVELNRERLQTIEQQVIRLDEVRQEQARALLALESIPEGGASNVMIPLGGGVQIIADVLGESGAVIDIGSGVQVERTREEALEMLTHRNEELIGLMDILKAEFDETEKLVIELANQFNDGAQAFQDDAPETAAPSPKTPPTKQEPIEQRARRRRRKRGTDLTLDD